MHEIFNSPSCEVRLQDIVCSHWLLKMRKVGKKKKIKLTRFCQICFVARGAGGVEEIGNCEEGKKQGLGGGGCQNPCRLTAWKPSRWLFFSQNLIHYRINCIRRCSSSSSLLLWLQQCFKAAAGTKAPSCRAKEYVSLQVKGARWGQETWRAE